MGHILITGTQNLKVKLILCSSSFDSVQTVQAFFDITEMRMHKVYGKYYNTFFPHPQEKD